MSKRYITTRVMLDGAVDHTFSRLRRVYSDSIGEYVNFDMSKRYITDDSFDLVYHTGKKICAADLFKKHFGVEQ